MPTRRTVGSRIVGVLAGIEIVGLSVVGPPPVGIAHLPWRSGIQVLYGPNGAGKSRILKGVGALWQAASEDDPLLN